MVPDPALRAPATNRRRLTVVEREDNALAARCAMGARKQRSSGQTMEDSAPGVVSSKRANYFAARPRAKSRMGALVSADGPR